MLDKVKEMKEHITLRQTTMTFSKETVKVVKMSKLSTKKYEYVDRGVLHTRTNSNIISLCFEIKYIICQLFFICTYNFYNEVQCNTFIIIWFEGIIN